MEDNIQNYLLTVMFHGTPCRLQVTTGFRTIQQLSNIFTH